MHYKNPFSMYFQKDIYIHFLCRIKHYMIVKNEHSLVVIDTVTSFEIGGTKFHIPYISKKKRGKNTHSVGVIDR